MKKLILTLFTALVLVGVPLVISSAVSAQSKDDSSKNPKEITQNTVTPATPSANHEENEDDNDNDDKKNQVCTTTWDVTGTYTVTFLLDGDSTLTSYAHDAFLTQTGSAVTGNGGYPVGGPYSYAWAITSGAVSGTTINLTMDYSVGAPGTTMHMTGNIAPDGTMSGTWDDNFGGARTGTWSTTAGAAKGTTVCTNNKTHKATGSIKMSGPKQKINIEVKDKGTSDKDKGKIEYWNYEYNGGTLHYKAKILCANVNPTTKEAWFMFQIPAGWPGLTGLYVVAYVKDGGTPGTNGDLYGHTATADLTTALNWCETGSATVTNYQITSGNLVVK